MGKTSREKGKRGERELAAILHSYGYDAHRGVQYHGGPSSPDVTGLPGIHIECKRTERLNIYDAMSQSIGDAGPDEVPVVMHRRNECDWLVVMKLIDFIELYREGKKS